MPGIILDCPYCGGKAHAQDSARIYGQSYGLVYLCENYPSCESFVGAHKASGEPLGTLANKPLRELRKKCHAKFDQLWKTGLLPRQEAYQKLASKMDLPADKTHMAMFNEDQCRTVLEILEQGLLS